MVLKTLCPSCWATWTAWISSASSFLPLALASLLSFVLCLRTKRVPQLQLLATCRTLQMAYPAQPCPRTPTCPPTWTSHSGSSPRPDLSKVCPVLEGNSAIPLVAPLSVTLHVSSLVLQLALLLKLFSPPPRLPCQSPHQHLSLAPPAVFLLLLLSSGGNLSPRRDPCDSPLLSSVQNPRHCHLTQSKSPGPSALIIS